MGVIFFIAFASLSSQILGLAGSDGILPVTSSLNDCKDQFGSVAPIIRPSIFWFNSSDSFLKTLTFVGMGSSIALISGITPGISLLLCWLTYLSFKNVVVYFLGFQWDDMLLECGFLALFIVPWSFVDPVVGKRRSANHPYALFLLRWMLFRVMFCSGIVKLIGGCGLWLDFSAIGYYWETQLLPNQLAWYLFALPKWFQTIGAFVTFLVELIVPFSIFAKGRIKIAGAISLSVLQGAMFLTGNHGFINLLTATLCLLLFDDRSLQKFFPKTISNRLLAISEQSSNNQPAASLITERRRIIAWVATLSFVGLTIVASTTAFWPKSQFAISAKPALATLLGGYHLTGRYGLYPIVDTRRLEVIVEGSKDGKDWKPYTFKYHIGALDRSPPSVSLHQPRLDWRMRFAAIGEPALNPWVRSFVQRLLQGSQSVLALLDNNPFPDGPPKVIRVELYNYQFTTELERRSTGNWWRRQFVEHYLPATALAEPSVRSMAFAGSWYPRDPVALEKLLKELQTRANLRARPKFGVTVKDKIESNSSSISAILVPHAAYHYSGIAAMGAYLEAKQKGPKNLKRIILLGPLHGMYGINLNGAVLPSDKAFSTPLGNLKVDTKTIELLSKLPHFTVNENAHDTEHSLEMQLPMVRYVFKNVAIVPILITNINDQESIAAIASGLKSILNEDDLVIVSGDMTHWGKMYGFEPFTENVQSNVKMLDEEAYSHIANLDNAGFSDFKERTKESMCCFEPASVLIDLLQKTTRAKVIDYYTSQDAVPKPLGRENNRCVGYLSVTFFGKTTSKN